MRNYNYDGELLDEFSDEVKFFYAVPNEDHPR